MADEKNLLLNTRATTHGEFSNNSHDTWRFMRIVMESRNWDSMPDQMRHGLYMILHKVARAIDGNIYLKDHWDDMAGYANLVSNRINNSQDGLFDSHIRGKDGKVLIADDFYGRLAHEFGLDRDVAKNAMLGALATEARVQEVVDGGAGGPAGAGAATSRTVAVPHGTEGAGSPATPPQPEPTKPGTPEDGGHHAFEFSEDEKKAYEALGWSFDLDLLNSEMSFIRKEHSKTKIVMLLRIDPESGKTEPYTFRCPVDFLKFNSASAMPKEVCESFKDALTGVVAWMRPICKNCRQPSSEPCPMVGNSEAINCKQYRGNTPESPGKK